MGVVNRYTFILKDSSYIDDFAYSFIFIEIERARKNKSEKLQMISKIVCETERIQIYTLFIINRENECVCDLSLSLLKSHEEGYNEWSENKYQI